MKTFQRVSGSGGDWVGIYIDGVLDVEGHSIRDCEWEAYLAEGPFQVFDQFEVDEDWLRDCGSLPKFIMEALEHRI